MKTKIFTKLLFCSFILLLASCATKRGAANKPEAREKYVAERTTKVFENGEFVEAESYDGIIDLSGLRVLVVDRATEPSAEPIMLSLGNDWKYDYRSSKVVALDTVVCNEAYSNMLLINFTNSAKARSSEAAYMDNTYSDREIQKVANEHAIDVIISLEKISFNYNFFFGGKKYTSFDTGLIGSYVPKLSKNPAITSFDDFGGRYGSSSYETIWRIEWVKSGKSLKVEQSYFSAPDWSLEITKQAIGTAVMAADDFVKLIK